MYPVGHFRCSGRADAAVGVNLLKKAEQMVREGASTSVHRIGLTRVCGMGRARPRRSCVGAHIADVAHMKMGYLCEGWRARVWTGSVGAQARSAGVEAGGAWGLGAHQSESACVVRTRISIYNYGPPRRDR